MVVASHPVDRLVRTALHVQCDDHAGLLGAWTRRPGRPGAIDVVARLLVGEQEVTLESMLLGNDEVRAEALVVRAGRNHHVALQEAGAVLVQAQPRDQRVREVGASGGRWPRERERHGGRLVVDVDVNRPVAVRLADRDPVRNRFEGVSAGKLVPDAEQRFHRDA